MVKRGMGTSLRIKDCSKVKRKELADRNEIWSCANTWRDLGDP